MLICHNLKTKYIYTLAVYFSFVFLVLDLKAEEMKNSYFHLCGVSKKLDPSNNSPKFCIGFQRVLFSFYLFIFLRVKELGTLDRRNCYNLWEC